MNPNVRQALHYCPNLPSPPRIAMQILEIGRDPEVDFASLSRLLMNDPALASRILRASNSVLYTQRRRSDNLRQAMVVIGLNATLTLALSFSLSETLGAGRHRHRGIRMVWRRAMIAASTSRLLGEHVGIQDLEELFLAGMLQDIGVLALDAALPEMYRPLIDQAENHDALLRKEREVLGTDHGENGAWLMRHWGLQERLALTASAAHDPEAAQVPADARTFVNCVAVAGQIADLFLGEDNREEGTRRVADSAGRLLGVPADVLQSLLDQVAGLLPEVAELYDTEIISSRQATGVLDQAREILAARTLQMIHQVEQQQRNVVEMERARLQLLETASLDALTGLHNRRRFDEVLETEFRLSTEHGWPLTLGFIDLDHFKRVNDSHGHLAGDAVLSRVADILLQHLRECDFVMRYGGDEFIAVLPGTGLDQAAAVFDRLREAIAREEYVDPEGRHFHTTSSIGLASHMDGARRASSAMDLIRAADKALYEAKGQGRDRTVVS